MRCMWSLGHKTTTLHLIFFVKHAVNEWTSKKLYTNVCTQDYHTIRFVSLSYKHKVCLFSKDNKINNNIISSENPTFFPCFQEKSWIKKWLIFNIYPWTRTLKGEPNGEERGTIPYKVMVSFPSGFLSFV